MPDKKILEGRLPHANNIESVEVKILVNDRGLDLLRTHTSPLYKTHSGAPNTIDNITFKVCQRTINQMQPEQNSK